MHGQEQFEQHAIEWVAAMGFPVGADPVESAVTIGKNQILHDVQCGTVPASVRSFSELHDYVDANYYGNAFEWPVLPSESSNDVYVEELAKFWNTVQDRLHDWITSGGLLAALSQQESVLPAADKKSC